jgi:hypothetical protein
LTTSVARARSSPSTTSGVLPEKKTLGGLKAKCVDEDGNEMDVQNSKRPHRMQWWKDEFDFQTYATSIKTVGFDRA